MCDGDGKITKKIILEPGRTFGEFSLLPGYTGKDCDIHTVSLETKLADDLVLGIPFLSAAMTSVTGYEMALALGMEGGLGVLPVRMLVSEQVSIVERIKRHEMGFVENPDTAYDTQTIEQVLGKMDKHGHSKIPVVDRNNVFKGMFTRRHYWDVGGHPQAPVTEIMMPFDSDEKLLCHKRSNINIKTARKLLEDSESDYLVVLDGQSRLVKMAFAKDMKPIRVASAINTHRGWRKRVEANIDAGVDLIVIDTSDAYGYFAEDVVVKKYKDMDTGVPICAGNLVTYDGALMLMNAGADIIKVGMSSGSICTTQREKAVGRAPMTALIDVDEARKRYYDNAGRYVPLIADGGISSAGDMIIALTVADAIMMGNYFNKFFEAAGDKLDEDGKVTRLESKMRNVITYGEGSEEARNLERYGHSDMMTFFPEGVSSTVDYAGFMKPSLKADALRIKAAMVNAGCMNLQELREESVIELMSEYSKRIVTETHDIDTKR
ncbi:MAG: IMP dehydrogenase [Nanoarchaeota archaeon]|nr:IMP dehydrogenase [DPANN group archaeon]MBL7116810.1 IMP dehydrogenase [Nanoarchaeota archaeon]